MPALGGMGAAALKLSAQHDWCVFAAPSNGEKKGIISGELRDGPGGRWGMEEDPAKITAIWKQHPKANIGLPTGAGNGLFVVETDTKQGGHKHDGAAELVKLQEANGELPETLTARSPSGSMHYYFQHPGRKVWGQRWRGWTWN